MGLAKDILSRYCENMPSAQSYSHIFNKGIEGRIIFGDSQDYEVFTGFLKDYLTPTPAPESTKKIFTIKGRTFRGTPHQPKNHFNKVSLLAYSLMPDHFHLIIQEMAPKALESFIRSLFTRYSMYFNKKYNRTGSLFEGPYKSAIVKDKDQLSLLIHFIHHGGHDYSSHPEYSGKRSTSWLNKNVVPFDKKVGIDGRVKALPKSLTLENQEIYLEESNLTSNNVHLSPAKRIPEYFALTAVLLILVAFGVRNINVTKAKSLAEGQSAKSEVLSESTNEAGTPSPEPTKNMIVVKIADGADSVNIRSQPTTQSAKIGSALEGETFEFMSVNSGWYEIKLTDGSTGFISSMYAVPKDSQNP